MSTVTNQTKTLLEMVNTVYFLTNEDSGVFPKTNVVDALNIGLAIVHSNVHKEDEEIYRNTSQGVREYLLPEANMLNGKAQVQRVWITEQGGYAEELSPQGYQEPDETDDGTPETYAVVGNTLYLYPTPDLGTYTITVSYRKDFVPLVNDSDTTDMNDLELDAAVKYAVYLLKLQDEEFAAANSWKGAFQDALFLTQTIPTGVYGDGYGGAL